MKTFTAGNLDELLENASAELGCAKEQLNYNVTEQSEESVTAEVFTSEDVKEFIFNYLGNFFVGIDQDLECAIEDRDGSYIINLNADNNAVLIGRQGKTIAALNTILKSAVNYEFHKRLDVLVDVNHYKEDRYHKLASTARRVAKQVQRSHVEAALDPMPNDERKAIHKALQNFHNIKTESAGSGEDRHVCIKYVEDEETAPAEETPVEE